MFVGIETKEFDLGTTTYLLHGPLTNGEDLNEFIISFRLSCLSIKIRIGLIVCIILFKFNIDVEVTSLSSYSV